MQIVTSFKLLPKLAELDNKIWGQFSSWHKITPPVAQIKSYFHRKVLFSMFPWVKGLIVTQASVCQRQLVLTFSNTRTTTLSGALSGAGSNLSGLFMCSCYWGVLVLAVVTISIWCTVWYWSQSWTGALFMCSCYCGVLVLTVVTVSIWCTVWYWGQSWTGALFMCSCCGVLVTVFTSSRVLSGAAAANGGAPCWQRPSFTQPRIHRTSSHK